MGTSLIFFSQLNMCESKEKTFFKLIHGSAKEEASKEAKIRAKEKRNRLSLLLQRAEFHEEPHRSRSGPLARDTSVCPKEAARWGESFEKLLSHKVGFSASENYSSRCQSVHFETYNSKHFILISGSNRRLWQLHLPPLPSKGLLDGLDTFTRFLKTEFSEENIEFWKACEDFKKSKDPQQILFKAQAIYEKFIQTDAPQEVNLDFHTKELITQSITQPTLHSFDAAQSRVYQLMEQDSYKRFLKSDIYIDLLEGRPHRPSNLRRRSRSFTYNEFQDVKSDVAIWL